MPRFTAFVFLALAAGCGDRPLVDTPESVSQRMMVFADVPMPDGLKYVEGDGKVSPSGHLRVYEQKLQGPRRLADIATFYREKLPLHGWTKQADEGKDPVTLTFVKKSEKCVVTIGSAGADVKASVKLSYKN